MGYTHYFYAGTNPAQWAEAYPQIQLDAVEIIKAAGKRGVRLADGIASINSRPEITEGVLRLNGVDGEDYETFALPPVLRDFDFCKTGARPYDVVVTAILLRAAHHAPDGIKVSSDGTWEEWAEGRDLVREVFGATAVQPWGVE